jgi:hypothetical protein
LKRNRKCNSEKYRRRRIREKYRRRRIREKANATDKSIRQREIDHKWVLIHEENRKRQLRMEELKREWHVQEQRLVNILAKHLCQLSPEYAKELSYQQFKRNMRGLSSLWGGMIPTWTISEEPFMAITDEKKVE